MNQSDLSVRSAPYGLAFAIEDLVMLRSWATQRRLHMTVLLDRVIDGADFEELLVLAPDGSDTRSLTVWRTKDTVFAQTPVSNPHAFASMAELLADLRPARPRRPRLMRRLGLRG